MSTNIRALAGDYTKPLQSKWRLLARGHEPNKISLLYLAFPIKHKPAEQTNEAIRKLLMFIKQFVRTLTFANGREFSWHSAFAKQLEYETFFAKPYHSWERGLHENHKNLLRQFFPKTLLLYQTTEKELSKATDLMNN